MELKVKEIGHVEPKSKQEVEAELLKKHDEQFAETEQEEVVVEDTTETESTETETAPAVEEKEIKETPSVELTEENVLSYIKERYDKEINSVDDLFQEQKVSESIPEDVANFLKYKKETGRSIEDYVKLQSNHRGTYKNHGEWVKPVFPSNISCQGSPLTPYIFDDRCSFEDAGDALFEWYNVGPEERERCGEIGRQWVKGDDARMTNKHLSESFIKNIETTFENWKPKQKYTLEVV